MFAAGATVVPRPLGRAPVSQISIADPAKGYAAMRGIAKNGSTSNVRPGSTGVGRIARADRARLDLGGDLRDLMIAEADVQQHLVGGRVRERIAGHVQRVAVGLGAVPELLHQAEEQLALELVRVRRVERAGVGEVERARATHSGSVGSGGSFGYCSASSASISAVGGHGSPGSLSKSTERWSSVE